MAPNASRATKITPQSSPRSSQGKEGEDSDLAGAHELVELGRRRLVAPALLGVVVAEAPQPPQWRLHPPPAGGGSTAPPDAARDGSATRLAAGLLAMNGDSPSRRCRRRLLLPPRSSVPPLPWSLDYGRLKIASPLGGERDQKWRKLERE